MLHSKNFRNAPWVEFRLQTSSVMGGHCLSERATRSISMRASHRGRGSRSVAILRDICSEPLLGSWTDAMPAQGLPIARIVQSLRGGDGGSQLTCQGMKVGLWLDASPAANTMRTCYSTNLHVLERQTPSLGPAHHRLWQMSPHASCFARRASVDLRLLQPLCRCSGNNKQNDA